MPKEGFNPLTRVFEKPDAGSPMEQDFDAMASGGLHNVALFDEEGSAHGGEKINPATGKPNVDAITEDTDGLTEVTAEGNDILGDIQDPAKMSLEELERTQHLN